MSPRVVVFRTAGAVRIILPTFLCTCMAIGSVSLAQPAAPDPADGPVIEVPGLVDPRVPVAAKPAPESPSTRYGVVVDLPLEVAPTMPIDVNALLQEDAGKPCCDKVMRNGVGRDIDVNILTDGQAFDIPGVGRLWTVDVVAAGALGIRLHFEQVDLAPGAEIVVYAPSTPGQLAGPYSGRGPHGSGEFWTPTRFEDRVRVEYLVPAAEPGADDGKPPFVINQLQHIYRNPITGAPGQPAGAPLPGNDPDAAQPDPAGEPKPAGPREDPATNEVIPKVPADDAQGGLRAGECNSGGCTNSTTEYPTGVFSTTSSSWQTFTSCAYAGEHTRFSVVDGATYEWSACTGDGAASCSWDSQFMLRNTAGNNLCYNDDYCGLQSKIRWTATFTGEVRLARMEYSCSTNETCATLVWRRVLPCRVDVTCYPTWANVAKAVARIAYVSGGNNYICTGQLLNSQASDFTPYFLTADHCINTTAEAQSAVLYWRYQTSTCNGSVPSLGSVPQSTGCTLLSHGSTSDYSLLMVEGELPSGLHWVGWLTGSPSNGTAATGVHHPSGSHKRISWGTKTSTDATDHWIAWDDGGTEGGSSGSGIYTNSGQQLFGQLSGNVPDCHFEDNYGAFALTYPNISTLLAAGSDDYLEQNDSCATARTMTSGTSNNLVVKSADDDWYRINVPAGGTIDVDVNFTDANGDIDIRLYSACGGSSVAASTSTTNNESISYTNTGSAGNFYLRVYLFSDTRNGYNMTIDVQDRCLTCPSYDYSIVPSSSYLTHSASFTEGGCRWYRAYLFQGTDYRFTVCEGGGSYSDDTVFELYNSSCTQVASNDDACVRGSRINYTPPADGYYYLKVRGYASDAETYTLAYRYFPDCVTCPSYDYTIAPNSTYNTHSASFPYGGCRIYRVYLNPYTDYRFTVCEGGGSYSDDTVFQLYNSACSPVASDDDTCGLGSQIDYTPTTAGYYYLKIRGFNDDNEAYTLAYRYIPASCSSVPGYDHIISPTTTYQTHSSNIHVGGCKLYRVSMTAGRPYRFTFCEGGGTASYDTYLTLRNSSGTALTSNDDHCNLLSELTYNCTNSGTYFLEVNSCCTGSYGGTYSLAYRRGACVSNSDCSDGNVCTDDVCSGSGVNRSCTFPNNTAQCSDGLFCNGPDSCAGGLCTQHVGDPCPGPDGDGDCSESCNESQNNCTANDPNGTTCNDGLYCTGSDSCQSGSCAVHTGDPCPGPDGDGDCSESCNETQNNCTANDPNGSTCNDGLYCTGSDSCSAGGCALHTGDPCDLDEWCNEATNACIPMGTGDTDYDGDLDLIDFAGFQRCYDRPAHGMCAICNMAGGEMIDLDDLIAFVEAMDGP